jgi:hypothetical protein
MKKGFQEIARANIPHMAQAQNMFDFPPAPKLNVLGRLDRRKRPNRRSAASGSSSARRTARPATRPLSISIN